MDSNLYKFPILSYVLSISQPNAQPQLPPETLQNLLDQFPRLADPTFVASLSQSVSPTVAQCHLLLRSLGPRPDPATVAAARSKISDAEFSDQVELFGSFGALIRLEEMHAQYEKQLSDAEEMLHRLYGSLAGDLVHPDPEVNEEVVRILKDAETKVVERIDLCNRQLRILPEVFGKLRGLVSLNLSYNELEIIPDSIAELKQLQEFDVSSNQLSYLPDSIGLLSNLKVLNVSGNKLKALPESIAGCSSLVELDASFNSMICLPTNIGYGLSSLQRLSIQLNKIRSLPASICEMRSLTYLDVHFNELHGLPPAIGRLTNLEVLNLGSNFNDLTELPEIFGDLVNLKELDLSNNQIRALPDTFYRLDNLTNLNLDGNPLAVPPMEIANQGAGAVKEFMAQRWLQMVEEEQQRIEHNSQQGQSGWLGRGTSLIGNLVSGVSQSVRGYLASSDVHRDPYLDQQL